MTPLEGATPVLLTPERWQGAALARQASAETTSVEADLMVLQRTLEGGKPDPVPAMLLAQRIYARHHAGASATAPARTLLIEAAAAAARYAAGSTDRTTAIEALTAAQERLKISVSGEPGE